MMPTIPPYITWQDVDGELALFDERDDRYHVLNDTAAAIWRGIAAGMERTVLIEQIATNFRVKSAEIIADIDAFIEAATAQGLLLRKGGAPA